MQNAPYVPVELKPTRVIADFAAPTGRKIRPLHGVNSGPMNKVFTYDCRPQFVEAGFPYARLHDVEYPYGSGYFVDIPNLFPDFDKDENDPANYEFDLTDEYLKTIIETGCEPFFRLGVSIEHAPIKKRTFPPKDFAKWARICEHVIRHYTEGWANGYEFHIDYWEIWNEADGSRSGSTACWGGTAEEFYEFYSVAATHLKKCFPHLKIGGPGFTRPYNEFTEGFLQYISSKKPRVPMDFYSWHVYFHDLDALRLCAKQATELMEKYGYGDAESILDEWNLAGKPTLQKYAEYADKGDRFRWIYTERGSSLSASALSIMQKETDISVGCYFEADVVKEWCGLYRVKDMSIGVHKATVAPTNVFYAFKSFNELYKLGNEVAVTLEDPDLCATAAVSSDGKKWGLLLSNYSHDKKIVKLRLSHNRKANGSLRLGNDKHLFEILSLEIPKEITLDPFTFIFAGNVLS